MAKKDTTSLGFEEIIWKAADVLRGNLSASHVNDDSMIRYRSDKYVPDRTKVKEDEGPRKWVIFIPMGGQNKKY